MGFLSGIFNSEQKDNEIEQRWSGNGTEISSIFSSQERMLEEEILKIPSVQMCLELISGTIAQLPIYLYKENSDGSIERIVGDSREFLLNDEPNDFQTAYNFKKNLVKDYYLYGVSYSYIEKLGNTIKSLHSIPAKSTTIKKYVKDGFQITDADIILNEVNGGAVSSHIYKPHELLMCLKDSEDGLTSKGLLHYGQATFEIADNELEFINNIYKNGAMPLGVLKTEGRLNPDALEKLKRAWSNLYTGRKNAGKTIILENGLEYVPISQKPKDLLVNEIKKDNINEICKLFNIPESLITGTNKYGSIEQNNIHFLQYTLSPILTSIENGLNKSLLLEEEKKNGYFWAVDTAEVLKTTEIEKYQSIKVALDAGVITLNEARYKLNMPAIKDDVMKWSLGNILYYPATGEMKIPNMGIGVGPNGENVDASQQNNDQDNEKNDEKNNQKDDKKQNNSEDEQKNDKIDGENKKDVNKEEVKDE